MKRLQCFGAFLITRLGNGDTTRASSVNRVYCVPGATLGGWPSAQWYQPQSQIFGSSLEALGSCFPFTISRATNAMVGVEASTNLQNWTPFITNTLVNGTNTFWDSAWTNYPQRFYRVRSQ